MNQDEIHAMIERHLSTIDIPSLIRSSVCACFDSSDLEVPSDILSELRSINAQIKNLKTTAEQKFAQCCNKQAAHITKFAQQHQNRFQSTSAVIEISPQVKQVGNIPLAAYSSKSIEIARALTRSEQLAQLSPLQPIPESYKQQPDVVNKRYKLSTSSEDAYRRMTSPQSKSHGLEAGAIEVSPEVAGIEHIRQLAVKQADKVMKQNKQPVTVEKPKILQKQHVTAEKPKENQQDAPKAPVNVKDPSTDFVNFTYAQLRRALTQLNKRYTTRQRAIDELVKANTELGFVPRIALNQYQKCSPRKILGIEQKLQAWLQDSDWYNLIIQFVPLDVRALHGQISKDITVSMQLLEEYLLRNGVLCTRYDEHDEGKKPSRLADKKGKYRQLTLSEMLRK